MNFAVFIISHERADRVETYDTLKRGGYTGQIFVVIDNEDSMLRTYLDRFGDDVLIFDKQHYKDIVDTITNDKRLSSAVYARNAVEDFAKLFELDAFGMFDDDVTNLRYRYLDKNSAKSQRLTQNLDIVFNSFIEYLIEGNIATLSFANVMIYAGGVSSEEDKVRLCSHRYTTCIHIRNTKLPVVWMSLTNEDSISGGVTAQKGYIWWTLPPIVYDTSQIGVLPGGMKSIYDKFPPFSRAFLSTVALPSVNRVGCTKDRFNIHRNLKSAYPMIISSRYKK